MLKQFATLHLFLCLFFSLSSVGTAQTLPPEALNAAHRIQVVAVSDDKPLEAAEAFAKDFSARFDLRAYVIHKDGWYKVLLGDFADKAEMRGSLKLVKKRVKDAWSVAPDNEKIVAIWEKGRRVDFSQTEPVPTATPQPEVPRPRAIREEPRSDLKPENAEVKLPSLEKERNEIEVQPEIRRQDAESEERKPEALATPTPLPGVLEEDLLAGPSTTLDVIIPTPAPTVSLDLPEFSENFEKLAAPPDETEKPDVPSADSEPDETEKPDVPSADSEIDVDELFVDGAPERSEPPTKDFGDDIDELVITIDDLQLDELLGEPQPAGELPSLAERSGGPVLVKISPDDEQLVAVGFADGTLELWDLEAKELRFRNSSHSGRICDLSFAFKKQHLSSVGADGSFKVRTLKDGSEQQSLDLELPDIRDVKFDHVNARLLVLHQNRLTAFDPSNLQQRQIFPAGEFLTLDEEPLGERDRLVCPPKADAALIFDLECCSPVLFQQLAGGSEIGLPELFATPLSAAAFSPSGHFFALGRGKVVDIVPGKARVEVYQFLPSGKKQAFSVEFLLAVQAGLQHDVTSLAFSPKSSVLLAGHENGGLQLFHLFSKLPSGKDDPPELSARAGKVLRDFEGHSARVSGLAFFPDGKRAISVSDDGTLRVWNLESGKEIERLNF